MAGTFSVQGDVMTVEAARAVASALISLAAKALKDDPDDFCNLLREHLIGCPLEHMESEHEQEH